MKKKIAVIFLTASLALVGLQSPSTAAPKVYPTCASLLKDHPSGIALSKYSKNKGGTLAQKPKVSASIYKANKKLDLDKDGLICERLKKPAPTPSVAPSPTPTPSPVEPDITMDNLDAKFTSVVAQRMVSTLAKSTTSISPNLLSIQAGPSLTEADIAGPKQSLLSAMSFFSDLTSPRTVNVVWMSGSDGSWIDSAVSNAGAMVNSTPTRGPWSDWITSVSDCNMGAAGIGSRGPYIIQCLKNRAPANHAYHTASHEYFHIAQDTVAGATMPYWFREGSADFSGIHVGALSYLDFDGSRKTVLQRYWRDMDSSMQAAIRSKDVNAFVARMKGLEPRFPDSQIARSAYSLGMFATEAMIASGGLEKFYKFMGEIQNLGFSKAFESNYGLSLESFYQKLAPYVFSQLG